MTAERGPRGTWQHLALWENGQLHTGATLAGLPADDKAAMELIRSEHGDGWLVNAETSGTWHIWDQRCRRPDGGARTGHIVTDLSNRMDWVLGLARQQVAAEANAQLPPDAAENLVQQAVTRALAPWEPALKYAAGLRRSAGAGSLLKYLEIGCKVPDEVLDERYPGELCTASGMLDLATLDLPRRHSLDHATTYCLDTAWNPRAECPRFWKVLLRMCGRDYDVACYLVKCLGYALLGDNREQKVFFITGPTGSGKSLILHIVSQVLGPLAHASQSDLICVVRHGRNARTENSIRGKRLITITETSSWMSIEEAQLKRLTGERVISVNQHYAKTELRTPVTWTIFIATNTMPTLTNFDAAMRRRVIVIPAGLGLSEEDMDPRLADGILSTEREGILALLARGCRQYFREGGLEMPWAVREATELYAAEQNTVAGFVGDTMALGGWGNGIPQSEAWKAYQQWARGTSHLGRNEFMAQIGDFPGISWNKVSRRFEGVAWNEDWAVRTRIG